MSKGRSKSWHPNHFQSGTLLRWWKGTYCPWQLKNRLQCPVTLQSWVLTLHISLCFRMFLYPKKKIPPLFVPVLALVHAFSVRNDRGCTQDSDKIFWLYVTALSLPFCTENTSPHSPENHASNLTLSSHRWIHPLSNCFQQSSSQASTGTWF